jgi:hypothetical protein
MHGWPYTTGDGAKPLNPKGEPVQDMAPRAIALALMVLLAHQSALADDPCGDLKLSQAGRSYTIENKDWGFSAILKGRKPRIECTGCIVVSWPPPGRANRIECSGRKEP